MILGIYLVFFSVQEAYSAKNKISAATKLIDYIEGKQVQFTEKALTALRDGQLNRICTKAEIDVEQLVNNFTNPRLYSYSTTA